MKHIRQLCSIILNILNDLKIIKMNLIILDVKYIYQENTCDWYLWANT